MISLDQKIEQAASKILNARHAIAFTGAGISLESGIPTFRGSKDGLWSKYDPDDIEISHFLSNPAKSWRTIKACFVDFMKDNNVQPNMAHKVLADLEKRGLLKTIITQNIDNLHQAAGSKNVIEFHGTSKTATCQKCHAQYLTSEVDYSAEVPSCKKCGGLIKPDFVFFGEGIPSEAMDRSQAETEKADVCIMVGTSAVVMPAGMIPIAIHNSGGTVIEVNPTPSAVTDRYTDIFIPLGAVEAFTRLAEAIDRLSR